MRCFTDAELRRGISAVIAEGLRIAAAQQATEYFEVYLQPSPQPVFVAPAVDVLDLFLDAARRDDEDRESRGAAEVWW